MISNPEVADVFRKRAKVLHLHCFVLFCCKMRLVSECLCIFGDQIVSELRRTVESFDFLEVETPVLQGAAGGAEARPFVTYHNSLGRDLYLRIATELHLKRMIVIIPSFVASDSPLFIRFLKYSFKLSVNPCASMTGWGI